MSVTMPSEPSKGIRIGPDSAPVVRTQWMVSQMERLDCTLLVLGSRLMVKGQSVR